MTIMLRRKWKAEKKTKKKKNKIIAKSRLTANKMCNVPMPHTTLVSNSHACGLSHLSLSASASHQNNWKLFAARPTQTSRILRVPSLSQTISSWYPMYSPLSASSPPIATPMASPASHGTAAPSFGAYWQSQQVCCFRLSHSRNHRLIYPSVFLCRFFGPCSVGDGEASAQHSLRAPCVCCLALLSGAESMSAFILWWKVAWLLCCAWRRQIKACVRGVSEAVCGSIVILVRSGNEGR